MSKNNSHQQNSECSKSKKEEKPSSKNGSTSQNSSYSKFTGATSIKQLLKMSYSDSTNMLPDSLNLSFPLTQTQQKQMKDDNYKFSASRQTRRNSALYEKSSQIRQNTKGMSSQKSVTNSERYEQRNSTTDSIDCNSNFVLRNILNQLINQYLVYFSILFYLITNLSLNEITIE